MNILFLDTETTGLDPRARMIQLAYKNPASGKIVNEYFKPPVPISYGAMAVHHITNEMVGDKPVFSGSQHHADLLAELEQNIVVAHNAAFDIGILKNEGVSVPRHIDTVRIARHAVPSENYSLQYLRYSLKLDVQAAAHDALGDILVLEALFAYLSKAVADKFKLTGDKQVLQKIIELNAMPVLLTSFSFGKYRGRTYEDVAATDKGYLEWLCNSESQKKPEEQNQELVLTLNHYLEKKIEVVGDGSLPF